MRRPARHSIVPTALALLLSLAPVAARAQQSDQQEEVVSFASEAESVAPAPQPSSAPDAVRLRPIAPPPAVVAFAGGSVPAGSAARVVPFAPKIVAGGRTIPVSASGSYSTQTIGKDSLVVTSPFGYRIHPVTGVPAMHTGVDLRAALGESVGASMAGTVVFAGYHGGYGNIVVVDHGRGLLTFYGHLSEIQATLGQRVLAGQTVGLAGSTGRSTGPHLHYEVRVNGTPQNPFSPVALDPQQAVRAHAAQSQARVKPVILPSDEESKMESVE
jgi:murein DD-endopeptidase MepM/ murein hydrolase activator NlpD